MRKMLCLYPILLLIAGCASSRSGQDEQTGTADQDTAIRQAVVDAFSLENRLTQDDVRSRDAVLILFRKGFHQELAEKLTDYYWLEDKTGGVIRATEPLFTPPEKIDIVSRRSDRVTTEIRKEGNDIGPNVWPAHVLEVVLRKEGAVWKVLSVQPKLMEQEPRDSAH